ncbi:tetratricopeptide repeat protein [Longibacter sp.]|uniref:tetratricopeptide repeat protein n=1 Tax=Longibacter sp. TaxID=2045415 RepID=UPI003EBDA632
MTFVLSRRVATVALACAIYVALTTSSVLAQKGSTKPSKSAAATSQTVSSLPPDMDSLFIQAEAAMMAENHATTVRNMKEVLRFQPENAGAHYLLYEAYLETFEYESAAQALRASIRHGNRTLNAQHRLAVLLRYTGEIDESLTRHRQLLSDHPDNAMLRSSYAETLAAADRAEAAIDEARILARMHPDRSMVRKRAVEIFWRTGARDEAFDLARENADHFPRDPIMIGQLADLHLRTGNLEAARSALEQMQSVIRRKRGWANVVVYANLGYVKAKTGQPAEGLRMIRRSLELSAENPYAHRNLGVALLALDRRDEACDAFRAAIDQNYDTAFPASMQFGVHPADLIKEHCP